MLTPHFSFETPGRQMSLSYLRSFLGTYPRLSTNTLWRNFFHLGVWGFLGLEFLIWWISSQKTDHQGSEMGTWYFSSTKQLKCSRSRRLRFIGEKVKPQVDKYCRWFSFGKKHRNCRGSEVYVWKKDVFPKKWYEDSMTSWVGIRTECADWSGVDWSNQGSRIMSS